MHASSSPTHITYSEVAAGSEGWLLGELSRESGKSLLYVANSDRELDLLAQQLPHFAPGAVIVPFPAWDCLPYDRVSPKAQITAERLAALSLLAHPPVGKRLIILTTVNAFTQKLPPVSTLAHSSLSLRVGEELNREALMAYLITNGYLRVGKAMEAGEFSVRGDIIDLFPSGYAHGCRIDLFGDDIESITPFDPLTQRSSGESQQELTLYPVSEILMTEASIERFRSEYRREFGALSKADPVYESASQGRHYPGLEHWLPLFYERMDTLFDYLPDNALTLLAHQTAQTLQDRTDMVQDYYQARVDVPKKLQQQEVAYHPLPPERLYMLGDALQRLLNQRDVIHISPFSDAAGEQAVVARQSIRRGRDFAPERKQGKNPFEEVASHIAMLQSKGLPITIACMTEGSRQRVEEKLGEHLSYSPTFITLPLPHGFVTPDHAYISESDILGERLIQTRRKRKRTEQFMAEAANFTEGELIVHKEHGIGRFAGLVTMEVQNIAHDCLKLIYADDDKLFLPVENIDLISRYGTGDEIGETALDKLGSAHWQSRKAKMKERIKLAAEELLKIAAKRELAKAPVLIPSAGLYEEFVNRFPYVETEDQEKAILDVLDDLTKGHPADRLICGDVGFGKTEVALRAAAATVMAESMPNAQVAIIAPTTLLVRQHYQNFCKRFEGFPVNVRMLSRLVGSKEKRETLEDIESGAVDIVIGTHALLSEGVNFKNLCVLIVDEEQHFGVKQKEKLKKLRSNIHVFTLSATPIPRTLQLSLAGVRELSLITTPPVDRLAVRTFVTPFDGVVIREALMREYHRGGQSFYVTPYISDMAELQVKLRDLVPDIKIAVANGQMAASELDSIMNDFYDGRYDVLLSTAIIESGIDIPNANTMIINRADRFGLSQLYQLRGRVGRSKTRAYAYLTLPHGRSFTDTAMKRLEVMQTLDTLGAGFSVASHDMDIRGFGNLVGEEQSGHVREVGVELYQHMLEEAVNAARRARNNEPAEAESADDWQPQISLGVSVLIPESYVPDLDLRLALYRRAGRLQGDEEIEAFELELVDRFGKLPIEVSHFLTTLSLKHLCHRTGIERLDVGPKGMLLTFRNNKVARPEGLVEFLSNPLNKAKLRADQKLFVAFAADTLDKQITLIRRILTTLHSALTLAKAA